jgi:hypothetical protein
VGSRPESPPGAAEIDLTGARKPCRREAVSVRIQHEGDREPVGIARKACIEGKILSSRRGKGKNARNAQNAKLPFPLKTLKKRPALGSGSAAVSGASRPKQFRAVGTHINAASPLEPGRCFAAPLLKPNTSIRLQKAAP